MSESPGPSFPTSAYSEVYQEAMMSGHSNFERVQQLFQERRNRREFLVAAQRAFYEATRSRDPLSICGVAKTLAHGYRSGMFASAILMTIVRTLLQDGAPEAHVVACIHFLNECGRYQRALDEADTAEIRELVCGIPTDLLGSCHASQFVMKDLRDTMQAYTEEDTP